MRDIKTNTAESPLKLRNKVSVFDIIAKCGIEFIVSSHKVKFKQLGSVGFEYVLHICEADIEKIEKVNRKIKSAMIRRKYDDKPMGSLYFHHSYHSGVLSQKLDDFLLEDCLYQLHSKMIRVGLSNGESVYSYPNMDFYSRLKKHRTEKMKNKLIEIKNSDKQVADNIIDELLSESLYTRKDVANAIERITGKSIDIELLEQTLNEVA
jgi:hypothetical protein